VGIAFQIVDDLLDLTGSPDALGKPAGVDVSQGVASLPLVIASRRGGEPFHRVLLAAARGQGSAEDLRAAAEECGAVEEAHRYAALYTRRAQRELSHLPQAGPRRVLEEVTTKLLVRDW
jgi:geranylgeranyl pyrophosphate synthase